MGRVDDDINQTTGFVPNQINTTSTNNDDATSNPHISNPTLFTDPFLLELTFCQAAQEECDCTGDLVYHDNHIICTAHGECTPKKPSRVCLSCMKRMCVSCFNDLHQHPMLAGCHTVSYATYKNARDMFIREGKLHKLLDRIRKDDIKSQQDPTTLNYNGKKTTLPQSITTLAVEDGPQPDGDPNMIREIRRQSLRHQTFILSNSSALIANDSHTSQNGDDAEQPMLSLDRIGAVYKHYFSKQKSQKHVLNVVKNLTITYGGAYPITFYEFLIEYTKGNTLFYNPVGVTQYQKFHALNPCGRFFYYLSLLIKGTKSQRLLTWKLPFCRSILSTIRSDQGENVYNIFYMLYNMMIINLLGIIFFILLLLLPWLLVSSLRDWSWWEKAGAAINTPIPSTFNWIGLVSGSEINKLPIAMGAYPSFEMMYDATNMTSTTSIIRDSTAYHGKYFTILFPVYVFGIFLLSAIYLAMLVIQNRASLSLAFSSPALLGSVSTTIFTMFQHNLTETRDASVRAQQEFDINIRMSLIKKYNPDQRLSTMDKFANRSFFPFSFSILCIILSSVGLFFVNYYLFDEEAHLGAKWLPHLTMLYENFNHLKVLIFPFVFFFIKWIVEEICIRCVNAEVPKQVHLYNRFRSVLFYRLSLLNLAYLIVLIIISIWQRDNDPIVSKQFDYAFQMFYSITFRQQMDLGYCNPNATPAIDCTCSPQVQAFFWYRFLIVGLFFEVFMFVCSLFKALLRKMFCCKCCKLRQQYFAPIPRLTQTIFYQCLVWCSVMFLPGSIIFGFITIFITIFLSFVKMQLFKEQPKSGVYLLPSKIQFYTSFAILLIVSYIPSAVFMSDYSVNTCGPFVTSRITQVSPLAMFIDRTNGLPMIIRQVFSYMTNPLVLWIFIITNIAIIMSLSSLTRVSKRIRDTLTTQLKIDSSDRQALARNITGTNITSEEIRGEKLFLVWMQQVMEVPLMLVPASDKDKVSYSTLNRYATPNTSDKKMLYGYLTKIQRKHPNFLKLAKLSEKQILHIFQNCGCPENIAHTLLIAFLSFRDQQFSFSPTRFV